MVKTIACMNFKTHYLIEACYTSRKTCFKNQKENWIQTDSVLFLHIDKLNERSTSNYPLVAEGVLVNGRQFTKGTSCPVIGASCSLLVAAIGSDLGRFAATGTVTSRPVSDWDELTFICCEIVIS